MSTIWFVNYNGGDEARGSSRRLAAAGAAFLRPEGEPPAAGRGARALPRPMPRASPDRAGPPHPHGPARPDPRLRRVERDGARGPAGVARPVAAPPVGGGPPR